MDLTGIKFMSDKKQSTFFPCRYASTASSSVLHPAKTLDYPFVRLTGNLPDHNTVPGNNNNNHNNTSPLLSQAKTFKTDMVGGFVGSKSQVRSAASREPHQIWDVVISKLNDFVRSKLIEECARDCYGQTEECASARRFPSNDILGSLFRESGSPIASFILASNAGCYLRSPAEPVKRGPPPHCPPVFSSPVTPTTLHARPLRINLSDHIAPHVATPLIIPEHCTFADIPSIPMTSTKLNGVPTNHVFPAELLYKNMDAIGRQFPGDITPSAEQKSYADVAKMTRGKCSVVADQRDDGRRQKRGSGRRGLAAGNLPCGWQRRPTPSDPSSDRSNWRDHEGAVTVKDARREAFRQVRRDGDAHARNRVSMSEAHIVTANGMLRLPEKANGVRVVPTSENVPVGSRMDSQTSPRSLSDAVHAAKKPDRTKRSLRFGDPDSTRDRRPKGRHNGRGRVNLKPCYVHEKHPNYDRHGAADKTCRYYDAGSERCTNWRCRHDPCGSCPDDTSNARPGPRAENTLEAYVLRIPCERISKLPSPACNGLTRLKDAAVEKCAEALNGFRARSCSENGDTLIKNLSRIVASVKECSVAAAAVVVDCKADERGKANAEKVGDRCRGLSAAKKHRTVSEDSEDSFVIMFGVGDDDEDGDEDDDEEGWSDESNEDDSEEEDDDDDEANCATERMVRLMMGLDDETCVSPRLQEVNARWEAEVERGKLTRGPGKKVRFASPARLAATRTMVTWDYAYRSARCGPWEEMARDRERFRQRVLRCEPTLAAVLTPAHRARVLARARGNVDR